MTGDNNMVIPSLILMYSHGISYINHEGDEQLYDNKGRMNV